MPKKAISVSLEADNLAWLRGRAMATGRVSISGMLDRLIREARSGGKGSATAIRSVVGTIELAREDRQLRRADRVVRALISKSLARRLVANRRSRPGGRPTA